jgi:hypothetical protein
MVVSGDGSWVRSRTPRAAKVRGVLQTRSEVETGEGRGRRERNAGLRLRESSYGSAVMERDSDGEFYVN